jgi:hypothetical protein
MTNLKPWKGGRCPEDTHSQVRPVYRGPAKPGDVRITCGLAGRLDWSHDGGNDDIVAYEVLLDRRTKSVTGGPKEEVPRDVRQAAHTAVFEFEDWVQRSQRLITRNPEGTEAREQLADVIARALLAERLAQKKRDIDLIQGDDSGEWLPPAGFHEVFWEHVCDVAEDGSVLLFTGANRDDWYRFFRALLKPVAEAVRRGSEF